MSGHRRRPPLLGAPQRRGLLAAAPTASSRPGRCLHQRRRHGRATRRCEGAVPPPSWPARQTRRRRRRWRRRKKRKRRGDGGDGRGGGGGSGRGRHPVGGGRLPTDGGCPWQQAAAAAARGPSRGGGGGGEGRGGGGERGDVVVCGQSGAPRDRMASISAQSRRGRRNSQRRTGGRRSRGAVETAEACGDGGRRASLAKRRGRGGRARRLAAAGRRPARVGNPHGPPTLRWHATGRDGCRGQLAAHPSSAGCAPAGGHLCRSVSLAAARGSSAGSGNLRRPTPPQK